MSAARAVVTISAVVVAGVVALVSVVGAVGCATTKAAQPQAVFDVVEDAVGPRGARCGRAIPITHGPLPDGAVASARYMVTSSSPVPLAEVEAVLKRSAVKRCADGVSILQAVVEDGAGAVSAVRAVAWLEASAETAKTSAPEMSEMSEVPDGPRAAP